MYASVVAAAKEPAYVINDDGSVTYSYNYEEHEDGINLWKAVSRRVRFMVKLKLMLRESMIHKRGKMISYPITRGEKFRCFYGTLEENIIITLLLYLSYFFPEWDNLIVVFLCSFLPLMNGMEIEKKVKY